MLQDTVKYFFILCGNMSALATLLPAIVTRKGGNCLTARLWHTDAIVYRLINNVPALWRGDLQIAPRDDGFSVGSEDPPGARLGEHISGTQH